MDFISFRDKFNLENNEYAFTFVSTYPSKKELSDKARDLSSRFRIKVSYWGWNDIISELFKYQDLIKLYFPKSHKIIQEQLEPYSFKEKVDYSKIAYAGDKFEQLYEIAKFYNSIDYTGVRNSIEDVFYYLGSKVDVYLDTLDFLEKDFFSKLFLKLEFVDNCYKIDTIKSDKLSTIIDFFHSNAVCNIKFRFNSRVYKTVEYKRTEIDKIIFDAIYKLKINKITKIKDIDIKAFLLLKVFDYEKAQVELLKDWKSDIKNLKRIKNMKSLGFHIAYELYSKYQSISINDYINEKFKNKKEYAVLVNLKNNDVFFRYQTEIEKEYTKILNQYIRYTSFHFNEYNINNLIFKFYKLDKYIYDNYLNDDIYSNYSKLSNLLIESLCIVFSFDDIKNKYYPIFGRYLMSTIVKNTSAKEFIEYIHKYNTKNIKVLNTEENLLYFNSLFTDYTQYYKERALKQRKFKLEYFKRIANIIILTGLVDSLSFQQLIKQLNLYCKFIVEVNKSFDLEDYDLEDIFLSFRFLLKRKGIKKLPKNFLEEIVLNKLFPSRGHEILVFVNAGHNNFIKNLNNAINTSTQDYIVMNNSRLSLLNGIYQVSPMPMSVSLSPEIMTAAVR